MAKYDKKDTMHRTSVPHDGMSPQSSKRTVTPSQQKMSGMRYKAAPQKATGRKSAPATIQDKRPLPAAEPVTARGENDLNDLKKAQAGFDVDAVDPNSYQERQDTYMSELEDAGTFESN